MLTWVIWIIKITHGAWINLPKAYDGISHIYQDIETTTQDKHLDFAGFSWKIPGKNDISGTGRLILNHPGELTLSGNNTFAGATVKRPP